MSWQGSWKRRGEWLEVTPGKALTGSDNKEEAALVWMQNVLGMPDKLLRKLRHEKGIQVAGDRLRLSLFKEAPLGIEPRWFELEVLYEDDFCLVVHKPAGMKVHPDGSREDGGVTLDHAVASYYQMNGLEVPVRHVHRLDSDTTGPVLYAKNDFAQAILDEQMRAKTIGREYAALVEGTVSPGLTVIDEPIGKDRHHNQRRRVSPSGQHAVTRVSLGEVLHGASLVHLKLETGRTHQIRVHLSHAGHPLLGDVLYGGPAMAIARQALHGELLIFRHPLTGEAITVEDPWPADMQELYQSLKLI
ncbi:RluA family pseudouridine synthase [Paenibacillus sp. JX-17]|uniref:Pseudouridine synthase n=1 Tax=Paenibacillus lacisoli TaxID=3064525 RepID=A0ABT9CDF8_9BACL|nr:RluA family pseudouridine synthase [Paenibacillus sp. JX-17]MDO7906895.1 RluA family pseudouridine synthase [Paenibacillus sp. JX-17]